MNQRGVNNEYEKEKDGQEYATRPTRRAERISDDDGSMVGARDAPRLLPLLADLADRRKLSTPPKLISASTTVV